MDVALAFTGGHGGLFVSSGRPQVCVRGFDVPLQRRPPRMCGPLDGLLGATAGGVRHL